MANFTPGPWEISQYTNYIGYSIWAKGAGCIAERWYPSEHEDAPMAENAHLIAAAPEMYEALTRSTVALEALYPSGERIELEHEDEQRAIASLLDYCRAALAKADGKEFPCLKSK